MTRPGADHRLLLRRLVRVLATMKIDNEPQYKEVLKQYPIPGVS
jgi:hypothetical protein